MSLFQCENCGCVENTALCFQGCKRNPDSFDWTGIEDRKGKMLCSACAPENFSDGSPTWLGNWHYKFKRTFLPIGEFKTDNQGNLEHIKTGSKNYRDFALPEKAE